MRRDSKYEGNLFRRKQQQMDNKRLVVVPRWAGTSSVDWYPWIKDALKAKFPTLNVHILDMPNPTTPTIENWVGHLRKELPTIDKNTYLVGHSVGCQTVVRYLEKAQGEVGGALFVAGWFHVDNPWPTLLPWVNTPIDFQAVQAKGNNFRVLLSDNDQYTPNYEVNAKLWKENIGAHVTIAPNAKHFNAAEEPAVLQQITEMLSL